MGVRVIDIIDPKLRERVLNADAVQNWKRAKLTNPAAPIAAQLDYPKAEPAKRLRQSTKPLMNKLEAEFYERIRALYPNYPPIRVQAKRYRLANGITYTPDFTVSSWPGDGPARETAWEVKGPWMTDDAVAKLKFAPAAWPEVRWLLVWKDSTGQWNEQRILP